MEEGSKVVAEGREWCWLGWEGGKMEREGEGRRGYLYSFQVEEGGEEDG